MLRGQPARLKLSVPETGHFVSHSRRTSPLVGFLPGASGICGPCRVPLSPPWGTSLMDLFLSILSTLFKLTVFFCFSGLR